MEKRGAIIIGATSGIGRALAEKLLGEGYVVGITGRRGELLEEIAAKYPETAFARKMDVTEAARSVAALGEMALEMGSVDLVVISAGWGDLNESLDFVIEERTIATNVTGFTAIADWAYKYFEKRGTGHLVAISSVGGLRGSGVAPAYNASKAYQMNYLEGLRQKAAKGGRKIAVTDIRPGFVDTEMAKGERLFFVATVERVVSRIWRAIRKRKRVYYVTRRWGFVAALFKMIPGILYEKL